MSNDKQPALSLQHGLNGTHVLILLAVIVVLTLIGWIDFTRRDVQT